MTEWQVEGPPSAVGTNGRTLSGRGQRMRRRLLEAAEEVFAQRGYHDASIVKITETAGVAQGTFYVYFESKRQIFDELVEDLNRRVRHAMSEASARGRTRVEAERLGFRGFFDFTAEHPALYRIIRQAEFVSPRALHLHYQRIAKGYVDGLRRAIDAGEIVEQDPEVIVWALMGIGELMGMRWILWGDPDDLDAPPRGEISDEVFEEMFRFIQRGLGARDR